MDPSRRSKIWIGLATLLVVIAMTAVATIAFLALGHTVPESKLAELKPGMSYEQVTAILGSPIDRSRVEMTDSESTDYWKYDMETGTVTIVFENNRYKYVWR